MRILVINPALPRLNALGACEQDRLAHVQRLVERGFQVHVLTGYMPYQERSAVEAFYHARQLQVTLVPIHHAPRLSRLRDFALLDGMAWEYGTPSFLSAVSQVLGDFQPERVWCHGSYLWPAALHAMKRGCRTIIRSVNFEPDQLLHERANIRLRALRYQAKLMGERRALTASAVAAISPDGMRRYQRLDPDAILHNLPLQTLPRLLDWDGMPDAERHADRDMDVPLHLFFMGASYNVFHNRDALRFLVEDVLPRVRALVPGAFVFHMLGSKVPDALKAYAAPDCIFEGYVPDLAAFLRGMDIAVSPSLQGAGMQQKVFEPLTLGFPLVTHTRGIAGYDFQHGVHLLAADDATPDTFAAHLVALRSADLRAHLGRNARAQAQASFSQPAMDARVDALLG